MNAYTPCKFGASVILHGVAFDVPAVRAIPTYMGKYRSYIRHWRLYRGLKQGQVIEKLSEIKTRSKGESLPATEASLSRIEGGSQNFNMALLAALAEIYEVANPHDLLTVNPFKGTLSIMRALDGLSEVQQDAALKVIEAMRSSNPDPAPDESKTEVAESKR